MTVQDVLDDIRQRPGTGDVIPIFDPSTEEQISEFTDCGTEAINEAVARAKETPNPGCGPASPITSRAKVLWRVADLIDENAEHPRRARMLNAGMPPAQAKIIPSGRVVPLLRGLVHQDRRYRARREHRRSHRG